MPSHNGPSPLDARDAVYEAVRELQLPPHLAHLAIIIAFHYPDCHHSVATLAACMGVKRSTAADRIRELTERGLLHSERAGQSRNMVRRHLLLPGLPLPPSMESGGLDSMERWNPVRPPMESGGPDTRSNEEQGNVSTTIVGLGHPNSINVTPVGDILDGLGRPVDRTRLARAIEREGVDQTQAVYVAHSIRREWDPTSTLSAEQRFEMKLRDVAPARG